MNNWHNIKDKLPATDRKVLCYCPKWNNLGYVVGIWNGNKFTRCEEPNNDFSECVEKWTLFMEAD